MNIFKWFRKKDTKPRTTEGGQWIPGHEYFYARAVKSDWVDGGMIFVNPKGEYLFIPIILEKEVLKDKKSLDWVLDCAMNDIQPHMKNLEY